MTDNKRFKVAVYDDKAINGFAVLDLQKPNSSKRLEYENVYIGSKAGCEIICNFGNNLADENEWLKKALFFYLDIVLSESLTDFDKWCTLLFNCNYEEAKRKYGDFEYKEWWESE